MDVDNDRNGGSCGKEYRSGWWHYNCAWANLNGLYAKGVNGNHKYSTWYHWGNKWQPLKSVTMMIRPKPGA